MVVQHNMPAINANRYLGINNKKLSKSLEKLSSGYQINRAGDNAAGLAVSEKMRSQIAGMTQGVKNAQDGISMVQTYEGALTETHSILQRMKTLADQMANGSYDDPVDRTAAQQEFLQLNDELDQIADTDFNGVVVLNGGQMADGTKAINGKFDYNNPAARGASKLGINDINLLDNQTFDNSTTANAMWANLNSAWTRTAGQPATYGPDSIDVTFQFDQSTGKWTAISASNGVDASKITTTPTSDGGFVINTNNQARANVVVNQDNLANGDTITITFNNPSGGISAPTNAGATRISPESAITPGNDTNAKAYEDMDLKVTLGTGVQCKDSVWGTSGDYAKLVDLFDGAQVDISYKAGAVTANGDMKITLNDGTELVSGSGTTLKAGNTTFKLKWTGADNKLEVEDGTGNIFTIEGAKQGTAPTDPNVLSSGTVSYKLGFENNRYDATAKPSVEVAKTGSVSRSDAFKNSKTILTYSDSITLQVGARTKDAVNFTFEYASTSIGNLKDDLDCTSRGLGTANLSIATQEDANAAVDMIDQAINKVSLVRGTFGAIQNRLEHKIDNMNVSIENLTSAESQIRDTDMPKEMMEFTKNQILAQAAQSMLAQANQLPQGVLSLLQ